MAPFAELSVTNFSTLLTKSEGRDKLARTVQFAARMIVGLTQEFGNMKAGTRIYWVNETAMNLMKQLASARRAHRWCKELPVIQSILQSLPTQIPAQLNLSSSQILDRVLDLVQKVSLSSFLIIDHIGWLKQIKLLSGGKRAGTGTIQLGLKFFGAANFFAMLIQMKKLADARSKEEESSSKQKTFAQNAFKHGLIVVQCLHLSRTYESHDAIVGFFGVISSFMDMLTQWPEKKAAAQPKPIADEKEKAAAQPKPNADEKEKATAPKVNPDAKAAATAMAR